MWYVWMNEKAAGPFTADELALMADRGAISQNALVWGGGTAEWRIMNIGIIRHFSNDTKSPAQTIQDPYTEIRATFQNAPDPYATKRNSSEPTTALTASDTNNPNKRIGIAIAKYALAVLACLGAIIVYVAILMSLNVRPDKGLPMMLLCGILIGVWKLVTHKL